MNRKRYTTRRLILRPYRRSDYSIWADSIINAPPRKSKHDWAPKPEMKFKKRDFQKLVSSHSRLAKSDHTYAWPIFEKITGKIVGHVDLYIIKRDVLQFANLGYRISNQYWRKGYGKEAVTAIIRAAFKDLKLNRIEAVIDLDNKPSIKFAKSVGLLREGIRRKYYYQHRRWDDQVVYVGLREDFGFPTLHK